jgi:DNA primase
VRWPFLASDPAHTDELRLDLDPQPGTKFSQAVEAAHELHTVSPDELTLASVPSRLVSLGDPWQNINSSPQLLEPLLEMHARDMAAGLMDAPWPPVYPKQPNEPDRVAPSRAKHT